MSTSQDSWQQESGSAEYGCLCLRRAAVDGMVDKSASGLPLCIGDRPSTRPFRTESYTRTELLDQRSHRSRQFTARLQAPEDASRMYCSRMCTEVNSLPGYIQAILSDHVGRFHSSFCVPLYLVVSVVRSLHSYHCSSYQSSLLVQWSLLSLSWARAQRHRSVSEPGRGQ